MGSVNDVGTGGQPLAEPPLTAWQVAVRDALNGSDQSVDARVSVAAGAGQAYTDQQVAESSAADRAYTDQEVDGSSQADQAYTDQLTTISDGPPSTVPARDGLMWFMTVESPVPGEPPVPTVWVSRAGAWIPVLTGGGGLDVPTADALYVNVAGDTVAGDLTLEGALTVADRVVGDLTVEDAQPNLIIQSTDPSGAAYLRAYSDGNAGLLMRDQEGVARWMLYKGIEPASDLAIARYDAAGGFVDSPFWVLWTTGEVLIYKQHVVETIASLSAGWTGQVVVQRMGNLVTVTPLSLRKSTVQTALEVVATIPVGYRPQPQHYPVIPTWNADSGSGQSSLLVGSNGQVMGAGTGAIPPVGTYHYGSTSYITKDPHP